MAYSVKPTNDLPWVEPGAPLKASGLRVRQLLGPDDGSVHFGVRLCELPPGADVPGHFHAFEESFYVLSGAGSVAIGDGSYRVSVGDYGFAPVGVAHAWRCAGSEPLRWLETRAPQPRSIGSSHGTWLRSDATFPKADWKPSETDPRHRWVGHFQDGDMAPYGPLSMPGYHGPNIQSISLRMMVDQLLGAQQHTLFMVEFAPGATKGKAANEHYHAFEETYFLLSGTALGTLDGEEVRVRAGDIVWTGVNATHAFINDGTEPLRWIEAQSPIPPTANAFFFFDDWKPFNDG